MSDISIVWDAANSRGDWSFEPFAVAGLQVNVAGPVPFGYGDGMTTQFGLMTTAGAISAILSAQIFRNDWQGNQLLYATPRTNGLGQSENLSASWTITRASLTQPGLQTLRGSLAYKLVEDASATTTHFIQRTSTGTFNIGDIACVSAFVHAGERTQLRLGTSASGGFASTSIIADLNAQTTTTFSGSPFASGVVALSAGWFRVWCAVQATSSGAATVQCILANGGTSSYTGDGASGLYVDAVQSELVSASAPGPTSYIPCPTTAAATVTDYTLTSSGALALAVAPLAGAMLSWSGAYVSNVVSGGYLETGNDLQTAVLLSLFTDRVANADDVIPDGTGDPRGWWGDLDEDSPIGSRLWLLDRSKQTQEVLNNARDYIVEALQWLVDDGVVASMDVQTEWTRATFLGAQITLYQPAGPSVSLTYAWAWQQLT
ncbi:MULTISPECIES: phage GP46 family protein [unclassified Caballeronia]|uniref:phage GP46 family protein n=1 Tax=unclassified Caballeronia TaxID=2646786 RepID=UPI0020283A9B|nr:MULTISPECIES: phage GP46 family protein [unclassified Caballeronia]